MNNLLPKIKVFIFTALLFAGASYISAQWSGPTTAPPGDNTAAPINVGPDFQEKTGNLSLTGALGAYGGFVFQDGNEAEGKVLVSDSNGIVRWDDVSSGGGGASGFDAAIDYSTTPPISMTRSGLLYFILETREGSSRRVPVCFFDVVVERASGETYNHIGGSPVPVNAGDVVTNIYDGYLQAYSGDGELSDIVALRSGDCTVTDARLVPFQ